MPWVMRLRYSGATPSNAKREWGQILKAAYEAAGRFWHRNYRKKHFTRAGAREYRYQPRRGEQGNPGKGTLFRHSYTGRKLREKGHTNPLEWSGDSKRATDTPDIRATRKRVRVVLHAPAFNYRRKQKSGPFRRTPPMWEEMTRVSRKEFETIQRVMDGVVDHKLRAMQEAREEYIG